MHKKLTLALISLVSILNVYAQDRITMISGRTVFCQITSIDSVRIELITSGPENDIKTFIELEKVASYKYNGKVYNLAEIDKEGQIAKKAEADYEKYIYADSIERANRYFLHTTSGQNINCLELDYKPRIFGGTPHFLVNSEFKFYPEEVTFYRDSRGYYARIKQSTLITSYSYAKRINSGRLNLYEDIVYRSNPGHYTPGIGFTGGGSSLQINYYYNIGFDDLKLITHRNLMEDISYYPESLKYLNRYDRKLNLMIGMSAIGGISLLTGILLSVISTDDSAYNQENIDLKNASYAALGVGGVFIGIGYVTSLHRKDLLRQAIAAFNLQ